MNSTIGSAGGYRLLFVAVSPVREAFGLLRFIVSLSFIALSSWNYRNTFDTVLSFLYRTILSKFSIRYPTLIYTPFDQSESRAADVSST